MAGRKQCTDFTGNVSNELDVKLGVSLVLFFIYVYDINNSCPEANFIKFADDTTILTRAPILEGAAAKMNEAITKVDLWFKKNKLNLNPDKTRYMIFKCKTDLSIEAKDIKRVWEKGRDKSFKLLGIKVDEGLKWNNHIDVFSLLWTSEVNGRIVIDCS